MNTPIMTRLVSSITVDRITGCWVWNKSKNDQGYGHIWFSGKLVSAHRLSYETFIGEISDGMTLDHKCRNTSCISPYHLEQVTMRENILRGTCPAANQARQEFCKRGHHLSGENVRIDPRTGRRRCRACHRLSTQLSRKSVQVATPATEIANR